MDGKKSKKVVFHKNNLVTFNEIPRLNHTSRASINTQTSNTHQAAK